jgi:hypothetical protein
VAVAAVARLTLLVRVAPRPQVAALEALTERVAVEQPIRAVAVAAQAVAAQTQVATAAKVSSSSGTRSRETLWPTLLR